MTGINLQDLAGRYISLWTEPDAALRRKAIKHLWAEEGAHILQLPVEIREAAAALGFDFTTLEARGHGALEVDDAPAFRAAGPGPGCLPPTATIFG